MQIYQNGWKGNNELLPIDYFNGIIELIFLGISLYLFIEDNTFGRFIILLIVIFGMPIPYSIGRFIKFPYQIKFDSNSIYIKLYIGGIKEIHWKNITKIEPYSQFINSYCVRFSNEIKNKIIQIDPMRLNWFYIASFNSESLINWYNKQNEENNTN